VGRVSLDDGPSLIAQVTPPLEGIFVGARVEGVFEDVTPEVTLLRWAVVDGGRPSGQEAH